jgi:hypothetical protein
MAKRQNKIKNNVEKILAVNLKARDDDAYLTVMYWVTYSPHVIREDMANLTQDGKPKKFVYLRDILELPREDSIRRVRAVIQNEENKYLPTTPEVRKRRKIAEEDWLEWARQNK